MLRSLIVSMSPKWREIIYYGFFGVATTVVNYGIYLALTRIFAVDYSIANAIAWILAVLFAFLTNKVWVFQSRDWSVSVLTREFLSFFAARLFSGVVDIVGLWLWVEKLVLNDLAGKIATSVIVIILNYIFSKLFVFRPRSSS